jgi:hypothetical protein
MRIRINARGVVDCHAIFEVPLSAGATWGQLRGFNQYARQDFFHAELEIEGGIPRAGAALKISHRFLGLRFARVGRILIWREGIGYSFSDLSLRGPRSAFPHVFSFRIEPNVTNVCRLHIRVKGLWTARHIFRPMAWLWLWWVFGQVVRSTRNELLIYLIWRKRNGL